MAAATKGAAMRPEDAEEYTQALGQVVAGGWRQVALGERLGVPRALGLTTKEWVEQRLGGYVRMNINERKAAVAELTAQDMSVRGIADVLGVSKSQVAEDRKPDEPEPVPEPVQEWTVVPDDTATSEVGEPGPVAPVQKWTPPDAEPLGVVATLVAQGLDEKAKAKAQARERVPEPIVRHVEPPTGKYSCIVIDPPWPMQKIERDERPNQGLALDYPTLDVWCTKPDYRQGYDEYEPPRTIACSDCLKDDPESYGEDYEPCPSIQCTVARVVALSAADDCHIYLWTTHKCLPDSFGLLDAWGFNYQCVMTWRKNVGITPYSWMYDTEHVLFGRRGNLPLEKLGLRLSFDAPVAGHSVKPDVFYDRVREASPGPRLDMFPGVAHDGFEPWGLEASHRDGV